MKTIKPFLTIIALAFVCSFLFFSCRVSRTDALRCPQVLTKENNKVLAKYKTNRNKVFIPKYRATIRKQPARQLISFSQKKHGKNINVLKNTPINENVTLSGPAYLYGLSKIEYTKRLIASIDNKIIPLRFNYSDPRLVQKDGNTRQYEANNAILQNFCDTIILKSGSKIFGKVVEIGQKTVIYRICDDSKAPVISILKSDISEIRNSNGGKTYLTSSNLSSPLVNNKERKTEAFGLAGFILSLISLISLGINVINLLFYPMELFGTSFYYLIIPMGLLGIILGIISLIRIRRNPNKYKGKAFAKLSLIIGIIPVATVVLAGIILFILLLIWIF